MQTLDIKKIFLYNSTTSKKYSGVAQSVEQTAVNRRVRGSSPLAGATSNKNHFLFKLFNKKEKKEVIF